MGYGLKRLPCGPIRRRHAAFRRPFARCFWMSTIEAKSGYRSRNKIYDARFGRGFGLSHITRSSSAVWAGKFGIMLCFPLLPFMELRGGRAQWITYCKTAVNFNRGQKVQAFQDGVFVVLDLGRLDFKRQAKRY